MDFKRSLLPALVLTGALAEPGIILSQHPALNVLLFTADDLDKYSLGCYGSTVPDISPNIDRFAAEGIRFSHAYINASICVPSRGILCTGLYGHNSGVTGFVKMPEEKNQVPLVMEILRDHGYNVGVLGKVEHSTPKSGFTWDYSADAPQLGQGKCPTLYYRHAVQFFKKCTDSGKPFYFMVNSHDPHRPYFNPDEPLRAGMEPPSRTYAETEIEVPPFLPDLPAIRKELSWYFNSVKRLDDTFGKVMQALEESGYKENTLVIFISDNGIAVPFAKANTYRASNHTPWIVRWPGMVHPGSVDHQHLISEVEYLPTILDALDINPPRNMDGRSHLDLYLSENHPSDKWVFTQIDNLLRGGPVPMRSIQNHEYVYIFNAWSDGERMYYNQNEGMTMDAMEKEAARNTDIAGRVKMFRFREPEEFYDLRSDPGCINNCMGNPAYNRQIGRMQHQMRKYMKRSHDPLLPVFINRNDDERMLREFYRAYPGAVVFDENKAGYTKSR